MTAETKGRLWLRVLKHNKIKKDTVVPCMENDFEEALREGARALDLAVPVILPKHRREYETFMQTRFLESDFLEAFPFDRLEIEYFEF